MLANRSGKHRALMLGSAGFASYMLLMLLMPPGSLWFFGLAAIWGGAMACAADMLPRSMMADVSDEDQLESGQDRTGMLFALLTVTQKFGQAMRSEEHTSELPSLMRISYAAFCLNTKLL